MASKFLFDHFVRNFDRKICPTVFDRVLAAGKTFCRFLKRRRRRRRWPRRRRFFVAQIVAPSQR